MSAIIAPHRTLGAQPHDAPKRTTRAGSCPDRTPRRSPRLEVAMPDGSRAQLPGVVWPEATRAQHDDGGRRAGAVVAITPETRSTADEFYDSWHRLGRCARPFRLEHFGLPDNGELVAMATSASTVSSRVTDTLVRRNCVELGRIASTTRHAHSTRALLRLYRLFLAPAWQCWPVDAVISYGIPGARGGQMYRFDGWTFLRTCPKSGGGGTYSRPSATNGIADGKKTLWAWSYSGLPLYTPTWPHAPAHERQNAASSSPSSYRRSPLDGQLLLL